MELVLVAVAALGAYWYFSAQKARRFERARALEQWEYDASDPPYSIWFHVHFPTMRMIYRFTVMDGPGADSEVEYLVRRKKDGTWQRKMTDESWRKELAGAQQAVDEKRIYAADTLKELVAAGHVWGAMPENVTPSLDTAYERYVRNA